MKTRIEPYPAGTPRDKAKRWLIVCEHGYVMIDGKRVRRRSQETFLGGVRAAEKHAKAIEQRYQHVLPDKLTVGEWLDTWMRDHLGHVEPRTRYGYEHIVKNHLKPGLGTIRLQELTALDIRAFYAAQERKGLSPTTINHHHRCLYTAMAVAEEADLVDRNPMHKKRVIKAPTPNSAEKYVLSTPKERQRVIEAAEAWKGLQEAEGAVRGRPRRPMDLHLPVLLALGMGLRAGEVCGLRWCDVDLVTGVLTTAHAADVTPKEAKRLKSTKTNLVRSAVMPKVLVDALALEKDRREAFADSIGVALSDQEYVCCFDDGEAYRPDRLSEQFRKMRDAAGLDSRLTFHGLRHTNASMQDSLGVSRGVTQSRMGHSSALMTAHYIHAFSADDARAAALIDADLRGDDQANVG